MTNDRECPGSGALEVTIAREGRDVEEAQRLRYRVFGQEQGAVLPSASRGLDEDAFDPFCDHLLVRDATSGDIVGTYRILPADRAARAGGFYTATEFDLGALVALPGLVEVGRACIDRRYRNGGVLALLWAGLASYLRASGYEHVMGCASVPADDIRAAADASGWPDGCRPGCSRRSMSGSSCGAKPRPRARCSSSRITSRGSTSSS